jgi:hypothetical protein
MANSNTVPGKPPANYKEVLYWKISEKVSLTIIMNLMTIPLAIVLGIGFFKFANMFGKPQEITSGISNFLLILFIGIIGTIVVIPLHEFAHGVTMKTFGAPVKYGFIWKGLMFYATSPGYAFQRNRYIVIILAPLVSLSILACFGILVLAGTSMIWLLAVWAAFNGGSAIGDLWITTIVLRYPSYAYIIDEQDGMRIFMPQMDTGSK